MLHLKSWGLNSTKILNILSSTLNSISLVNPLPIKNGALVKTPNDSRIWFVVDQETRKWVQGWNDFIACSFKSENIITVSDSELQKFYWTQYSWNNWGLITSSSCQ